MALLLSYIETFIPFAVGIPGIKIGLANLAVVLCLYTFSFADTMLLAILKAVLSGLLFGNVFMIIYNLSGAIFSCVIMGCFRKKDSLHVPVVSAVGGVSHNVGQLLVAFIVVKTYAVWYYMPFLLIAGMIMGLVNGGVATLMLPFIRKIIKNKECL